MERDFETYTIKEVAEFLRVGINQAYKAARSGEIPAIKIGKTLRVSAATLQQLMRG